MTISEMAIAILRVGALALLFGCGVPSLYALAMRVHAGNPIRNDNGEIVGDTEATPAMKALAYAVYVVLAAVIFIAILWIAKGSLAYYFNFKPFGSL
ncbi:MAG: hypothetical protein SPI12_04490 [Actinomycetaceae bacterium]|nr:hypothetical protein [Actinomycetaceae bacterium]MDY6083103.1 hypothetical protein [Actinomycetaceae bacterium]